MKYVTVKYILDRATAALALVLAAPILLVLGIAVRIDSRGPAVFRQRRIGIHGRPFTIYKLRTMYQDAPAYSLKVGGGDARITRLGRTLRRTGLDELPQVLNILRGEMSWVGPRPEQPFLVEDYAEWERGRLSVRPGLTGWWQVRRRGCQHMRDHVELDIYYVQRMSFWMDLRIVMLTPWALVREDAGCRHNSAAVRLYTHSLR